MRPVSREKKSVNSHLEEIFKNYFIFASKKENIFDISIPVVISLIIFVILFFFEPSNSSILKSISNVNAIALSIIAISAGLNTACLTLVATAQQETLKKLYNSGENPEERNILKQVITFFAFSILFQLIILVIGTVFGTISENIPHIYKELEFISQGAAKIILVVFGFVWVSIILYSFFISIRNIALLYRYVLYVGKNS
ncbi:hypothetical protein NQ126_010010 [Priestia megaterium]|uniref:hypothetical protein n=1 Tax=Priestia megaterium TaxID=1404 RepID=UPI0024465EC9|nr:hypothetical protein [Priestia megaterium]WRQ94754.1 hypothetical protein NQ126_010010 [Priestia megaterium]